MLKFNRDMKWRARLNALRNYRINVDMLGGLHIDKSLKKEFYRKAIHLSSLWIPLVIYFSTTSFAKTLFAVLLLMDFVVEYANYRRQSWARWLFAKLFARTLREKETIRASFQATGSMYVLAAALMCTVLFSKPIAIISLTVMLISDTAAALFGKACGTRKLYKNKSLEGTAAFFMSALFVNMVCCSIYQFGVMSVIACLLATFAEMYEDKIGIDDNFSIPLSVGGVLTLSELAGKYAIL